MSAPNPSTAVVPLRRPEEPADLWDRLVAQGMDVAQATALVRAMTGAVPRDATAVPTHRTDLGPERRPVLTAAAPHRTERTR